MKKYLVKKIYKYSIEVEVIADSQREAKDQAMGMDGIECHDDYLYDCEVVDEEELGDSL